MAGLKDKKIYDCRFKCGAKILWLKDINNPKMPAVGISLPPQGVRPNLRLLSDGFFEYVGTEAKSAKVIAHYLNCPNRPRRRSRPRQEPVSLAINDGPGGRIYRKRKKGSPWI